IICRPFVVCGLVFFFSSRRRHTRSKRDWSSDVCSSDLLQQLLLAFLSGLQQSVVIGAGAGIGECEHGRRGTDLLIFLDADTVDRSEERRVGKGSRYRRTGGAWREKTERGRGMRETEKLV